MRTPDWQPPASIEDTTVVFLHPGAMGSRLAGECRAGRRLWVSTGRSAETAARAESEGLEACDSLTEALTAADLVVSICPPAAATDNANLVSDGGFDGVYLDANPISPATMVAVGQRFERAVDGGVIGPPPQKRGTTRLYLFASDGELARWVASLWAGSALEAPVIGSARSGQAPTGQAALGQASALKMAYAAWTKGSAAMLMAVAAAASSMGVAAELEAEWDLSQPGLVERARRSAETVGPKAWRFAGEMEEITAAVVATAVPADFWLGANKVYQRLEPLKGTSSPDLAEVIALVVHDADGDVRVNHNES